MTRPAVITQAQIVRAIKAVKKAGANMAVECRPDGVICIVPAKLIQSSEPINYTGFQNTLDPDEDLSF